MTTTMTSRKPRGRENPKKAGGSNKLTIGLALAGVGVLLLKLGVAFFLLKGPLDRRTDTPVVRSKHGAESLKPGDEGPAG